MYVVERHELEELVDRLRAARVVAVDTEFMREKTYYARLCLIQVASQDIAAIVDPFALESLDPLIALLNDPDVVKVFHAGEQDLEILYRLAGSVPTPVFDTQVAATLAGFPMQTGYGQLVKETLGVTLSKADRYTDWSVRPLSDAQIEYALDDVRHLPGVYTKLRAELERTGRLEWLDADFAELADPGRYDVVPEEQFWRVKRASSLDRRRLGVLMHVAAWREREAQRRDIPRRWLVGDESLVEIARRMPTSIGELAAIRGVNERLVARAGEAILRAVEAGVSMPEDELPRPSGTRKRQREVAGALELMSALVRVRAKEHGIATSALASRSDLEALVRDGLEGTPLGSGWRRSHIGEELADLIEGRLAMRIEGDRVVAERLDGGSDE